MELCSIELGLSIYLKIQCLINKATLMNLKINGSIKSFDDTSMTIEELVIQLNLVGKRIAIEKNGMIISKSEFQNISLQDGDQLEIVGAVGGG
jgi:sulfur carrier protein